MLTASTALAGIACTAAFAAPMQEGQRAVVATSPGEAYNDQPAQEKQLVIQSMHRYRKLQERARAMAVSRSEQRRPLTDATSTNTADWACIREAESTNRYHIHAGAYGILDSSWQQFGDPRYPYAGAAPAAVQDRAALRIFAANGYHFAGSWNNPCVYSGRLH